MKRYQYLILGGGMAADSAVKGIREVDPEGSIGIISAEPDPPYARPKLSKGLWKGLPVDKIWKNTQDQGVDLYLGQKVTTLEQLKKYVRDENGDEYNYDKLLIATGGTPIHLPFGGEYIIYYRDFQDYQRLRTLTENAKHILVIGGSFIGSEMAAALTMVGKKATMVFLEDAICARQFPADLAAFLSDHYRQQGVDILADDEVINIHKNGDSYTIHTKNGRSFDADGIVAGIGIHPNVELAQKSGIKVDNGIVVDEYLRTSAQDVYAAGDVANFHHAALDKRIRVEHADNAVSMGKTAGRNMAGENQAYTYSPMFYSDLFDFGYEAVGELDSQMETAEDWQEPFRKGVVYYLSDGRVRGVLLWNVWDQVDAARDLLEKPGPFTAEDLMGKIQ